MKQVLRPLALVRLKREWANLLAQHTQPFASDMPLIYLGEIPNMPEHGVFAGHRSGRVYSGHHIEQFEEVPSEEV
jgi:hypothetical protein